VIAASRVELETTLHNLSASADPITAALGAYHIVGGESVSGLLVVVSRLSTRPPFTRPCLA